MLTILESNMKLENNIFFPIRFGSRKRCAESKLYMYICINAIVDIQNLHRYRRKLCGYMIRSNLVNVV